MKTEIHQSLEKHQYDYSMISTGKPQTFCTCGAATDISLPENKREWLSIVIENAQIKSHTSHQTDMLYEEVFQKSLQL